MNSPVFPKLPSRILVPLFVIASLVCRADDIKHARPDPKRFAKAIEDFTAADAAKAPPKGGIVFTGSSSVRLWKVSESFPDLPVLNRGFGGSVANDLSFYANEVVLRYEPKVLVVYTGGNDIHAKLTVKEALEDYTKFLELTNAKLPATKVIVCSVKVAPVRITEVDAVQKLNTLLEGWCKDKPWITWVEATKYLLDESGQPRAELYRSDRLHLSDEGYTRWNAIMSPVLHKVWAEVK